MSDAWEWQQDTRILLSCVLPEGNWETQEAGQDGLWPDS